MKKILIAAIALGVAAPLPASWKLVDDFSDGNADGWIVTRTGPTLATTEGTATVVDDPADGAAQGKVLSLYPGVTAGGAAALSNNYTFSLPEEQKIKDLFPAAENTSTLYLKMLSPLVGGSPGIINMTFGMMSAEFLGTTPTDWSWGNYSVLARNNNFLLDQHSGTGYIPLDTTNAVPADAIPQSNVWYEYWFVIDRGNNVVDGYIKGGQWATQTKVWTGSVPRLDPQGKPLDTIVMRTANDGITGVDALIFDDFYVDNSGVVNLTTPGGAEVPSGRMVNISTRGKVQTGADILIAGFVIEDGARQVLIRGIGPSLVSVGVTTGFLEDSAIFLRKTGETTDFATNDDWGQAANVAEVRLATSAVGAFPLAEGSKDAALLIDLEPGGYTVRVRGVNDTTGVALVEVYEVR